MSLTEKKAKGFIDNFSKFFWKNLEYELDLLSEKEGPTNSLNQKRLRALVLLNYRIKTIEKTLTKSQEIEKEQ